MAYIDIQTLRQNVMNSTASSMPQVMYRCRENVKIEVVNSMCLICSKFSPADVMKKKTSNASLLNIIWSNKHAVPIKRVFMVQHSLYRHSTFTQTSQVPMTEDFT